MQRRKIIDPFFNPQYFASSAVIIDDVVNESLADWKERAGMFIELEFDSVVSDIRWISNNMKTRKVEDGLLT